MWINIEVEGEVHTLPAYDIKTHSLSKNCWCNPEYYANENLIIHNSADGREDFENGTRLPS
jgi:hypothetical protein